eukprot:jgi/Orpsp1_1/1188118/evm.model.d7180000062569.1
MIEMSTDERAGKLEEEFGYINMRNMDPNDHNFNFNYKNKLYFKKIICYRCFEIGHKADK